jgi:hypothetical protein
VIFPQPPLMVNANLTASYRSVAVKVTLYSQARRDGPNGQKTLDRRCELPVRLHAWIELSP